ncbi:5-bromo-4-chloroindolyl phosphate hydrolysis family protein [Faecalibacterium sp. I3-3-33]|uniref:5-bromo-4-chloroindolyl phosphate hydrolysis family protein n=1 Tax=Faecalibacterium sp. I3-3-33 TaxID=2929492 RepID=UPI002014CF36|nr:5-bromo-4-chloroindolyl phosphate hydrolysis family protein [Faecalibacterium sp. I3-3-33]UQK47006.1 5-bromo-4-chloroindolyl phosphate hydrolysis family protein [Faecalibacterium sp. I3-3-33]
MYDRENDNRNNEGRQVQQELEDQLRAFGDTMTDAFAHGFEGRGMDIGDRAWDVGKAAVHAANYGIGEAAKVFRQGRRSSPYGDAKQTSNEGAADADPAGMPDWFRQIFAKPEPTPVENIRISAKKRYSAGCTLLAVGITFAVIFGLGGIGCIVAAEAFLPGLITETVIGDTVATAAEGMTYTFTTGASMATTVLEITGNVLTLVACGFGAMIAAGASRLSASKKLRLLADTAEKLNVQKGLSVEMLADLTHQTKKKALKKLRSYIHKGWLNAWLDDDIETLYLTAEDYRAAKEAAAAAAAVQPQPEKVETGDAPLNLDTARRFAAVLEKEQQLMQDAQAREELAAMHKTTTAICDWLEAHPESQPKTRRFAEYYIPTTLKLLHTYNDVQGQQGENAETIRRDIAGILHTLNQAYENLYNNLLSDVAMDISSEIAALQGMLANDGLTGREFE